MATLGELRSRIVLECVRDDLTDAPSSDPTAVSTDTLNQAIARAIEYFADKRFFFNESRVTNSTTGGSEYVTLPTGLRFLDLLSVTVGSNRYPLTMRDYAWTEQMLGYGPTNGQPTDFSISGTQVRLYPAPNIAYTLTWLGVFDVTPALDYTSDASSNAWTTYGEDLIAARARMLLMRDNFRDPEGATLAGLAEKEALDNLRGFTARRIGTGSVRASW